MKDPTLGRVEAFSDGVFAIVITLLILELRAPEGLTSDAALGLALRERWPSYLAFGISFATVGIMWINHHRLFRWIHRSDNILLLLNLLLLLAVTIVPFPTALLATYLGRPGEQTATLVYTGAGLGIAIAFNLLWRYAAAGDRLLGKELKHPQVRAISRSYVFGPVLYLVATALALWNVYAAVGVTFALALFFALPPERVIRGYGNPT